MLLQNKLRKQTMARSGLTLNETLKKLMTIDPELTFRICNAVALLA